MLFNFTPQDGPDPTDPYDIDWDRRQARAGVPFKVEDGLPINPIQPHLPAGRGGFWQWGPGAAVDGGVLVRNANGVQHLLVVERDDDLGWALPGGGIDPADEAPGLNRDQVVKRAVIRELAEETSLRLPTEAFELLPTQYVDDPRAARNAWMETTPAVAVLHTDTLPAVAGGDDARRAEWLPAGNYPELEAAIAALGGRVFPAHTSLLRNLLG